MDFEDLVGSIYDCAANPELWPGTLAQIRDSIGGAVAIIGFYDQSPSARGKPPAWLRRNSPWDGDWLDRLNNLIPKIPHYQALIDLDIDTAWTQLSQLPEEEFRQTEFYLSWVAPKRLRDTLTIQYLKRRNLLGVMSIPTPDTRAPITLQERQLIERLTPHIRRAVLINDLTDKGNMALLLYRRVLDTLAVAVLIVGTGQRIAFANAAAEDMLSAGRLIRSLNGTLIAAGPPAAANRLAEALSRGTHGDAAIGEKGIGVPLIASDGERAAAYVLPLAGDDLRGALGRDQCLVFVARRGEQQPVMLEILRSVYDLTPAEARVAALVAQGESPQEIAQTLNISVNTVRSQLRNAFAKTGTADQTSLGSLVNAIVPPVN